MNPENKKHVMGLYSTIKTAVRCGNCGWEGEAEIQFKYGNLYSHEYSVGDPVVWGRTQVGEPGLTRVVVEGVGACPRCDTEVICDIYLVHDVIQKVQTSHSEHNYFHGEEDYVILER